MTATDKLQRDVSKTTNAAISEGKKDVDHVKDVGAGYVEQVIELARSAIETAQVWFLSETSREWKLTTNVLDLPP
jgi:hypothetical protein